MRGCLGIRQCRPTNVLQQEKGKPTPSKSIRRRSRMSAASSRGLPAMAKEPTARKVYAQLCSPDGSQDMETGGSHSSDEECSEVICCGQPSNMQCPFNRKPPVGVLYSAPVD